MTHDKIKLLIEGLADIDAKTEGKFPSFKGALLHLEGLALLAGSIKMEEPPQPPSLEKGIIKSPGKPRSYVPFKEIHPLAASYFGKIQSLGVKRFNSWQMAEFTKIPKMSITPYLSYLAKSGRILLVSKGERTQFPAIYELHRDTPPVSWEAATPMDTLHAS